MSNFIIAVGHTASGNIGCGVIDRLNEGDCTRTIGALVVEYLNEKGHGANLLRIDKDNSYNCKDCYERVSEENYIAKTTNIELYMEIHINAGGGTGPEVLVTGKSEVANQYAAKVCDALANSLNLSNRGVKAKSLIVLNRTVMPSILVECLFADSDDAGVYNAEVITKAIVKGLVGTDDNGWKEIDREWYIFDSRGYALQDTLYYDDNHKSWYYLDENCKMIRSSKDKVLWKWIDDGCYAFNEHGRMYCDCVTPDGYGVDKQGMLIK